MPNKKKDVPGVIAPPPLIFTVVFLLGYLFCQFIPEFKLPTVLSTTLAFLFLGLSGTLVVSAFRTMKKADTQIDPYKPTTKIVTNGPFRFTRNPLYLSLTLLYSGISLLINLPVILLFLPLALTVLHYGVIIREERYLLKKFGVEYSAYKEKVNRWF